MTCSSTYCFTVSQFVSTCRKVGEGPSLETQGFNGEEAGRKMGVRKTRKRGKGWGSPGNLATVNVLGSRS